MTLLKKQTHHSRRPAGCLDLLLWAKIWGFSIFIESLEAFPSLAMEIFLLEAILTLKFWYHLVQYMMLVKLVVFCYSSWRQILAMDGIRHVVPTMNFWYHLVDYRILVKFVISCYSLGKGILGMGGIQHVIRHSVYPTDLCAFYHSSSRFPNKGMYFHNISEGFPAIRTVRNKFLSFIFKQLLFWTIFPWRYLTFFMHFQYFPLSGLWLTVD